MSSAAAKNGKIGVLLIGHGSRDLAGQQAFSQTVEQVVQLRPQWPIEPGYLELVEPNISVGIARLLDQGIERLVASPLLLFSAGHARRDIPDALASALAEAPEIAMSQAPVFACHPGIVELAVSRFLETVIPHPSIPSQETCLVMVGRGSRNNEATKEMVKLTHLVAANLHLPHHRTCFRAMASPSMEEVLAEVAEGPYRRVVVQPHLLFPGEVRDAVAQRVRSISEGSSKQWLVSGTLGPDRRLAEVLVELIEKTAGEMATQSMQ